MTAAGFSISEMERAALSSGMNSATALAEVASHLTREHFTHFANQVIFSELSKLWEAGKPYDLILFTQHLETAGLLQKVGGANYLTELHGFVPSAENVKYYIGILDDEYDKRHAIDICQRTAEAVKQGDTTAIGRALTELSTIPIRVAEQNYRQAVLDKIQRIENDEDDAEIITTGLKCLDQHSPLRKGDMPLIAGERKAGKSILALSIATNIARSGLPILYFSLEDPLSKVVDRLFAGASRIPIHNHTSQRISSDLGRQTAERLISLPFEIRDDVQDLHKIIAVARREKARHDAGLIVVDYAQLVRASGTETRREEVEKVSRDLRLLAMELHVPLLLLCQLNKEGETRESKALEMDATAMWRIDRTSDVENGERRLAIPWQRNGESGIAATVAFIGALARVENIARENELAEVAHNE
jgi:replicative DNA helicase